MKYELSFQFGKAFRGLMNTTSISLRFTCCNDEEFYAWLDKNAPRIQSICEKWNWSYDIGHSDKLIFFTKNS